MEKEPSKTPSPSSVSGAAVLEETTQGSFNSPQATELGKKIKELLAAAETSYWDGEAVYVLKNDSYNESLNCANQLAG